MDSKELTKRLDRIETKLDNHQELLWQHVTNDTKRFEQVEAKLHVLAQEQKWFKRIAMGVASGLGLMVGWIIEARR